MNIYVFIFARGGSKGVKGKNIKLLNGIPLIGHTINLAKSMGTINKVIVSTDNKEIAAVANEYNADIVINRPDHLATDQAKEFDAWKHAIQTLKDIYNLTDYLFVSLPCTAPLRNSDDVNNCINQFNSTQVDLLITTTKDDKLCWLVNTTAQNLIQPYWDNKFLIQRQEFTKDIRILVSICYVTTPTYILSAQNLLEGKISTYLIPYERSLDIDTEHDFKLATLLI